ncbi:MAG: N-acetyltransferase family protein [Kofleriaceae bacterium]
MHTLLDEQRMGGMARVVGNPWGIQVGRFGRAKAFVSSAIPTAYYNKVDGFGAHDAALLDDVAAFFIQHQAMTCSMGILPGDLDERLADRLGAYGMRHVGFHAGYWGVPDVGTLVPPKHVTVRPVETDEDLRNYLATFHAGWEMTADTLEPFITTMKFWRDIAGWRLFLADLDGATRGVGLMTVREGIAYLAIAATVPAFRNRGCEQALMHHAIAFAKQLGCELVCGQCEPDSPSANNFGRYGMQLAYHKAIWLLRPTGMRPIDADSLY